MYNNYCFAVFYSRQQLIQLKTILENTLKTRLRVITAHGRMSSGCNLALRFEKKHAELVKRYAFEQNIPIKGIYYIRNINGRYLLQKLPES